MPELPEVETLVRDLQRLLVGAEIKSVDIGWSRSVALPAADELAVELPGRRFLNVSRRGKFLQFDLSGPGYLLIHLRMTGHLAVQPDTAEPHPYARVVFHLTDDRRLTFSDPRKFGRLYWLDHPDLVLGRLGPDPLADDLTLGGFAALMHGRRGSIKPLLLDQGVLAGLGNIYTDEALFRAHIHPQRKACTLSDDEVEHLYGAVREVLLQAIDNRGTTLEDDRFRDAEGHPGGNRPHLMVSRHREQPCPCCGAILERTVVGGRGTYFCPHCQPVAP